MKTKFLLISIVILALFSQAQINISLTPTNITCNGMNNGSIITNVTGGNQPLTYQWNNGSNVKNINGLNAGVYTVTVTDALFATATATAIVVEPMVLTATTTNTGILCAFDNNGTATVNANGGTAPYQYKWSNLSNANTISNLGAGLYTVTVTDNNLCTASVNAIITEPAPLTTTTIPNNISCKGDANGSIQANPNGGTGPYTFLWINASITKTISNLVAGSYTVTVKDANNCSTTQVTVVTEPVTFLSLTTSANNISCNGAGNGSIQATPAGGKSPYTYIWVNGIQTNTISNLYAGSYSLTVTDANGCTVNKTTTVIEPPALTTTTTSTNISCNDIADGSIHAITSGGTGPYTYIWANGAITQTISALYAGVYTVTVKDANNCTVTNMAIVTQPAALNITTTPTNVKCNGNSDGSIAAIATGGSSGYTYLWSNLSMTSTISNLGAGNYTVTVKDVNGCIAIANTNIIQPSMLTTTTIPTNIFCKSGANGSIQTNPSGGTGPYTYFWTNASNTKTISNLGAGNYTVTITDANMCTTTSTTVVTEPVTFLSLTTSSTNILCNGDANGSIQANPAGGKSPYSFIWVNGFQTNTISNLFAGSYTVTVTDANGCTANKTTNVVEPPALTTTTISTNVKCAGDANGSIQAINAGGTSPYSYTWVNGSITQTISALNPGFYTVTVIDANGCTTIATEKVVSPSPLDLTQTAFTDLSAKDASNGIIVPNMQGGTPPYNYTINNVVITKLPITNLSPGVYTLIGTDANACSTSKTITISSQLADSIFAQSDTCVVDFSKSIDSISIASYKVIDQSHVFVQFTFSQAGITKSVFTTLNYVQEGWTLINLTLTCNANSLKAFSVTRTLRDKIFISYADINTGIIPLDKKEDIQLYPNPTNDILNIDLKTNKPESINVTIVNQLGEIILIANETVNGGTTKQINVQDLAPGMYFVTIISDSNNSTQKVIVK